MIAFLDIQATTNNYKYAEIIAFSIVLVDDGRIIEQLKTEVKPVFALSEKEEEWAGHTNAELRNKLCFADCLPQAIALLEGAEVYFFDKFSEMIWRKSLREVGLPLNKSHNILQELLLRRGIVAKKLDLMETLEKLSLEYKPEKQGLNAEALLAIYELLELTPADTADTQLKNVAEFSTVLNLDDLPARPGVYYFLNQHKTVIYVGKAVNLKERVKAHFFSKLPFEVELTAATFSLEYKETGNELISLLLESADISRLKPLYNTQQIDSILPWTIESRIDKKGVFRLAPKEKNYSDNQHSISFNRDSVLVKLKNLALQFSLCYRFAGLERSSGSCSSPLCKGVCKGLEDKEVYNLRAKKAFETLSEKKESYFLKLAGRTIYEEAFVLVRDGIYMGFGFIPLEYPVKSIEDFEAFIERQENTYFTNRSILQYLNTKGVSKFDLV
ncbi:GIY-YIG nuclease family protein [Leeuwenhoekiella sp. W20_SRS_FM14]|uniref:GIY-YIG nuclease family protein n=1 Tax=Leeuwenhoekiella sp. W20_SRS_FM14 TaxID=3240270 RepID=UPI003F96CE9E